MLDEVCGTSEIQISGSCIQTCTLHPALQVLLLLLLLPCVDSLICWQLHTIIATQNCDVHCICFRCSTPSQAYTCQWVTSLPHQQGVVLAAPSKPKATHTGNAPPWLSQLCLHEPSARHPDYTESTPSAPAAPYPLPDRFCHCLGQR
jgi:hypothetical protein